MNKPYGINQIFYSLQGEGVRAGTANLFFRFAGCNLRCAKEPGEKSPGGFDCDTEFMASRPMTLPEIHNLAGAFPKCQWIICTGGEPALQVDAAFIQFFHERGYKLAIETNGSVAVPEGFDWITVSPKVAEHCIRQTFAHEVKYVRSYGQPIPKTVVEAQNYLLSPAFDGDRLDRRTLNWCILLCLENPQWRLSVQHHKSWHVL